MIPVALYICVCVFEQAVISSRLYGLVLVRQDLYLWMGACCGPGPNVQGDKCRVCGAPGLKGHGVSLAQVANVQDINKHVILDSESIRRSVMATRALFVLSAISRFNGDGLG